MRKAIKFLHTLGSSGIVGGLMAYFIILVYAPQENPARYLNMRETIGILSNVILLPSLAVVIVTGLLSIAAHQPFQELRWVGVKALLGISMFEGTLAIIQTKANDGVEVARRIAEGTLKPDAMAEVTAGEWNALGMIFAISVVNIVLAVWRPTLKRRPARS
jgi:hypothetical protein